MLLLILLNPDLEISLGVNLYPKPVIIKHQIIDYRIFFLTASILIIPTFFFGPTNLASKMGM